MAKLRLFLLFLLFPFIGYSQCDVFIDGEVEVIDNGSGIKFVFDITNNSGVDWYGDVVKLYWTLNSSAPIWEIDYTTNTSSPPIADGETRTITTPWFDFPNLPSWFPDDPTPANPWLESAEWAYYNIDVTGGPFTGAWSPMNLRLGGCSNDMNGDGLLDQNVKDENGDSYYGPFDSSCPDQDHDAFCDCDVDFIGFDPVTLDMSVEVISHWNCGQPLNIGPSNVMLGVNHLNFGLHVPGWDFQWGCTTDNIHPGWTFTNHSIYEASNYLQSGDIFNTNLLDLGPNAPCFQEILSSDTLTACTEIVIWQINYSQTLNVADGGWATNYGGDDTQLYPDHFLNLNSLNICDAPPPLYPGCIDENADNYDFNAGYDDGSCLYGPVLGCTDPTACNYDSSATSNDGSCDYSCIGCMDENASNYNPDAIYDNNNCEYYFPDADPVVNFFANECNGEEYDPVYGVFVYNYGEDTLYQYCVEIPELSVDTCLNGYTNGAAWVEPGAGQFIGLYTIPDDITQLTINVYNVGGEGIGDELNNTQIANINQPSDNPCIIFDPLILDILPDEIWSYGGTCTDPFFNQNFLIENVGEGIIDSLTFNFNVTTWDGDVILDITQDYYTSLAPGDILNIDDLPDVFTGDLNLVTVTVSWVDENGELQTDTQTFDILLYCWGCTDPGANNYINSPYVFDAIPDYWLDEFPDIVPPTPDQIECEYDITELTYVGAECYVDCDLNGPFYYVNTTWTNTGNVEITDFCAEWDVIGGQGDVQECFNGSLMPGDTTDLLFGPYTSEQGLLAWAYLQVLNGVTLDPQIENYETLYCWGEAIASCIYGCIDATANNYDPTADLDDGSCTYDVFGCTDPEANNFNPDANVDDGSCTYDVLGCTDSNALNYNPLANVDDGSCEYDVPGCTDPAATNYNPLATVDDGSCEYIIYLGGCTDPEAANYNPMATYDDGSCYYLPEPCDGSYYAPNTFTPNNDGVNDGWTVVVADPDCWRSWYVAIYNRWGSLVWESTTVGEVWPASVFDGNHYVADGVYVYLVIGEGWDPEHTFKTTGNITIFR